jgi:hypothetical protein
MSDTTSTPAPADKTAASLCRLRTLTYVSLALNGLILLFIAVGIVCHLVHRHHHHGFGGRFGDDRFAGGCPTQGGFGGHQFHRFGGGFGPGNFGGGPGFGMRGNPGMMAGPKSPPDADTMTDMMLAHLTQALTLSDDQKAKIKPIIAQQVDDMQKQMEAQRAAMQKRIADARVLIRPLLNADQQKQLDALPIPGQKPAEATTTNTATPAPAK